MKNKKLFLVILVMMITSVLCSSMVGFAAMQSENYKIQACNTSCGGNGISSLNYKIISTIGQSSSLMDVNNDPPQSSTSILYPGFWYVADIINALSDIEIGDVNGDGIITLADVILALKITAETDTSLLINKSADSNGDGIIGIVEALYIMRHISGQ